MEELKTLVERYGNLKKEMDSYKKQVDADNKAIKEVMSETGITEFTAGGFVAKYSVAVSESFDEDKLLAKIEKMTFTSANGSEVAVGSGLGVIKMKPTIDMEALENAIYNGYVNAADLADCKVVKETPKLTIKEAK